MFRSILCLGMILILAACQTVRPPDPDDVRGPKPTDLRKHTMEVLEPESIFRPNWWSQIGEIGEHTQMVMSEVSENIYYITGGFTARSYLSWKYCATLVNPPQEPGDKARVGVMTIIVKEGEGRFGQNNCLWYKPTAEYEKAVKDAIISVKNLTQS